MTLHALGAPYLLGALDAPHGLTQEINAIMAVAGETIAVTEWIAEN